MLKVLEPAVPEAWEYTEELRGIDERRWYTNRGEVVRKLEGCLSAIAGKGVCVSSATLGLELAARKIFSGRKFVLTPAFSFPATAHAIVNAGFQPVFCDGYELRPEQAAEYVSECPWIDAVMPVCTFGKGQPGWEGFEAKYGKPVLIDAAAAFGNHVTKVPSVFSMHATKCLPAIEGGFVTWCDVSAETNFGFVGDRVARGFGTNAKLSEVHAAVGLASLRNFRRTTQKRMMLEMAYRENLPDEAHAPERPFGSYSVFPVLVENAVEKAAQLAACGIETARWQVPTQDKHPAFSGYETIGPLTECEKLEKSLLCLPYHVHMDIDDVLRVCAALRTRQMMAA